MAKNSSPLFLRGQPIEQERRAEGSANERIVSEEQLRAQGERKAGVARVTAADVIAPPTPRAGSWQSFEEQGIPESYRTAVENELTAGEKIVWLGRPSRDKRVHPNNAVLLMAGLGLIVFGVGVAVVGVATGMGFFPVVFGGALALIGGAFQIPRFVDPGKTCKACYVVTNRRAILVQSSLWAMGGPKAKSYLPHELLGMERRNHPEVRGAGDLIFEYYFAASGNSFDPRSGFAHQQLPGMGLNTTPNRIPRGFFLLDNVDEVEQIIRTTLLGQLEQSLDEPAHRFAASAAAAPAEEVVSITCACGVTIEAPASLAGKSVKCPECSAAVSVPAPEFDAGAAAHHEPYREDGTVPADLKAKTLAELDPREKVVWMGQPVPALIFVRGSAWLVIAGIGLLITAGWFINALLPAKAADAALQQKAVAQQAGKTAAAPKKESGPNLLIPLVFSCVWLGLASVPVVQWHFAKRTCYVLTNRRALVYKEGLFGPTRESYPPVEVANMRQSDSWVFSGHGDLIFRTVLVITTSSGRGGWSQSVRTRHYGFLAIPHVQEVATLVRETLIDRFVEKLNQASAL
jgi:hypothetical protein